VAALVEHHGGHGQAEHHEQQHRVEQHVLEGGTELPAAHQPGIRADQAGQHHRHDDRMEQRLEDVREMLDRRLADHGVAQLQREERLVLRGRGGVRSPAGHQAERGELARQQVADVVRTHRPAEGGADSFGDLADRVDAVDFFQHQVQQPRHLNGLAARFLY
jgi:hypothetical protein